MSVIKCLCGTDLLLRDTITSIRSTGTKVKVEESKTTGLPIVIQVQPKDEQEKPIFSHCYSLICPQCQVIIFESKRLSDVNDFILSVEW